MNEPEAGRSLRQSMRACTPYTVLVNKLIVLAYHKIGVPSHGATPTRYYISERTFEQHLSSIAEAGWGVVSHDEFICTAKRKHRSPKLQSLISFDDAYSRTCENATRILKS